MEHGCVGLAAALGSLAWLSLLLAELGVLGTATVGMATAAAVVLGVGLAWAGIRRDRIEGSPPPPRTGPVADRTGDGRARWPARIGGGILVLAVSGLFFPAYETTLWAGDSTVYLAFAKRISESGQIVFEDPLVGGLPVPLRRDVFRNTTRLDTTGPYARFPGGFLIPNIDDDRVTAGFSPLFPALLAAFRLTAGERSTFWVAPLFAALAVGVVFLIARRLGGAAAGLLAAGLATVCLPEIWYARFSVPESLAQFLALSGVLALCMASARPRATLDLTAGVFLGLAALAKVDIAVLGAVSLVALAAWSLVRTRRWPTQLGWLLLGFGVVMTHLLAHYLIFPTHYTRFLARRARDSAVGHLVSTIAEPRRLALSAGGVLLLAAVLWLGTRRARAGTRNAMLGAVLLALVAAYFANYFISTPFAGGAAGLWLLAYLPWPLLGLAVLGGANLLASSASDWRLALLPLLAVVVCAHYLYHPHATGEVIWDVRRFVPLLLPAVCILASVAVLSLAGRLSGNGRFWAAGLAAASLLFLTGAPSRALVESRPWAESARWARDATRIFAGDPVILLGPDLAGTHLATFLAYLRDLDAVQIQEHQATAGTLDELIDHVHTSGRVLYLVFGSRPFPVFAPELRLRPVYTGQLAITAFATTDGTDGHPTERSTPLAIYRAIPRPPERRRIIDVGDRGDDLVFAPNGFYEPETVAGGGESFRWTGRRASLRLPSFAIARLRLAAGRPEGVPSPVVSVALDGKPVVEALRLRREPTEVLVRNPRPGSDGPVELTITSQVFNPRRLGLSADSRELGVRLSGLELELGTPRLERP